MDLQVNQSAKTRNFILKMLSFMLWVPVPFWGCWDHCDFSGIYPGVTLLIPGFGWSSFLHIPIVTLIWLFFFSSILSFIYFSFKKKFLSRNHKYFSFKGVMFLIILLLNTFFHIIYLDTNIVNAYQAGYSYNQSIMRLLVGGSIVSRAPKRIQQQINYPVINTKPGLDQ